MFIKLSRKPLWFSLGLVLLFSLPINAQEVQYDDEGFEIFEYQDEDSLYTMKKYFIAFLKTGPNRSENNEQAMELQTAHLAHMAELTHRKKICIAGPFGDDTELRGIVIYNAKTMEEALEYAESDPAVKAGVLIVEIHPWWAAKNSRLY